MLSHSIKSPENLEISPHIFFYQYVCLLVREIRDSGIWDSRVPPRGVGGTLSVFGRVKLHSNMTETTG